MFARLLNAIGGWQGYVIAAVIAFGAGWMTQGWRKDAVIERQASSYANEREKAATALAAAEKAQRDEEQRRVMAIQEVQENANKAIEKIRADEQLASANRLRDQARAFASRSSKPGTNPAATGAGKTTGGSAGVLAELLAELDERAEIYAIQADRARVAGLTCEKSYESLTIKKGD